MWVLKKLYPQGRSQTSEHHYRIPKVASYAGTGRSGVALHTGKSTHDLVLISASAWHSIISPSLTTCNGTLYIHGYRLTILGNQQRGYSAALYPAKA